MKKTIGIVMILLMLMSVTVAWAGNAKDTQIGGEKVKVIIGYTDKPNQADEDMIRGHGGRTKYTYHIIDAKAVEIPERAIDRIKRNPRVAYVEEDTEVYALDAELDNSWGVKRIGAGVVHGCNTGAGVNVAIIDTGIDYTHTDLDDNYEGGYDYVNNDNDPMDDHGHGTHCAGIVAAEDNDEGVVGVAPEANLYAVKVLDDAGSGYTSDVVYGIQWSMNNGMQIISMSLGGGGPSDSLESACNNAYNSGIVVVAAAGNSGAPRRGRVTTTVGYPAAYNSVIAVSATDDTDTIASFSSRGAEVELAAPGVYIYSTYLGGEYETLSGTSMSCPHVSGTAALVIASGITGAAAVREQLDSTAEDLGDPGRDTLYGYGLVDADEAAQPIAVHDIAVTSIVAPSWVVEGNLVSVNVSVTNEGTYDKGFTVTLTDTSDDVGIGSETVTLVAGASTTITFSWNTTDATLGDHVLNATASGVSGETDTADNSVTGTVTVVEEAPANSMHIASIEMSKTTIRLRGWYTYATARVTIVDGDGNSVDGATVSGSWSGLTTGTDSGTTNAGHATLNSDSVKNAAGTFTFTADDVSLTGWTYNQTANAETSGSITVP
jgi:subtilisin family serine protease